MLKNSKVAILSLTAVVGALALYWVTVAARISRPIGLGLRSYTNACAVITVTNASRIHYDYVLMVERKTQAGWPKGWPIGIPAHQAGSLRPAEVATLTVPVMVHAPPYPWRISLYCTSPLPPPKMGPVRATAVECFYKLGLRKFSLKVAVWGRRPVPNSIQVSTQEMEQWEK